MKKLNKAHLFKSVDPNSQFVTKFNRRFAHALTRY